MTNNQDRRIVPHDQQVPVKVNFTDKKGNVVEYYMNFNNPTSVKKLVKSLHWGLVNGRTVTLVEDSVENANEYYKKKYGSSSIEEQEGQLV